jgi:hypothetical protein
MPFFNFFYDWRRGRDAKWVKNILFTSSTHLKLVYVYNISDRFGLSLAPGVYVMNSSRKQDLDYYKASPINPLYTRETNNKQITVGIGISIGLIMN